MNDENKLLEIVTTIMIALKLRIAQQKVWKYKKVEKIFQFKVLSHLHLG